MQQKLSIQISENFPFFNVSFQLSNIIRTSNKLITDIKG